MSVIKTKDGAELFYNDWGSGRPIVFIHGWMLGGDSWEYQTYELAHRNFRVITYDQRGCGRSDQPWEGYDYDTLADDLNSIVDSLDLKQVNLVGHSMGCGVLTRYLARFGQERIASAVYVATTTPFLLKTDDNPNGIDRQVYDAMVAGLTSDRPKLLADMAPGFFGEGLPGICVSQKIIDWAIQLCFRASPKATVEMLRTNSETDQRKELDSISIPTLVIHGGGDQISLPELTGLATARAIANSELVVYENAGHGLFVTHADRLTEDIAAFVNDVSSEQNRRVAAYRSVESSGR